MRLRLAENIVEATEHLFEDGNGGGVQGNCHWVASVWDERAMIHPKNCLCAMRQIDNASVATHRLS
jgi:hypothetical protein